MTQPSLPCLALPYYLARKCRASPCPVSYVFLHLTADLISEKIIYSPTEKIYCLPTCLIDSVLLFLSASRLAPKRLAAFGSPAGE